MRNARCILIKNYTQDIEFVRVYLRVIAASCLTLFPTAASIFTPVSERLLSSYLCNVLASSYLPKTSSIVIKLFLVSSVS